MVGGVVVVEVVACFAVAAAAAAFSPQPLDPPRLGRRDGPAPPPRPSPPRRRPRPRPPSPLGRLFFDYEGVGVGGGGGMVRPVSCSWSCVATTTSAGGGRHHHRAAFDGPSSGGRPWTGRIGVGPVSLTASAPRMGSGLGLGMAPVGLSGGPEDDRPKGKLGRRKPSRTRKRKKNKYAEFSKVDGDVGRGTDNHNAEDTAQQLDPWEVMIAESSERKLERMAMDKESSSRGGGNGDPRRTSDSSGGGKRERNAMTFPDVSDIDPYDPTTYGYVELGVIVGPHGVRGEVKLRSTTDFATERLMVSRPTSRHLRPKNRRSPREVVLLEGGRRIGGGKKSSSGGVEDVYLLRFEGVGDRDAAAALRGATLYAREEDDDEVGDALSEDEYMVSDLVGLDVFLDGDWAREELGMGVVEDEGVGDDDDDDDDSSFFVGTICGVVLAGEMSGVPGLGQDLLEVVLALPTPRSVVGRRTNAVFEPDKLVLIPFVPEIVPSVDLIGSVVRIRPPRGLLDLTYVRERKVRIRGFLPPARDE